MAYPTLFHDHTTDELHFAAWRCWAADVRDRIGPYRVVSRPAAERAKTLVALLDAWQQCQRRAGQPDSASNLCTDLEQSIEMLIGRLTAEGIQPPAELAHIAST